MEIKEMQRQSFEILENTNKKFNIKHEPDTMFLHLAEEVGEVARELSKKQKNWREDFDNDKLAEELVDVISTTCMIATDNNIDIEKAFIDKFEKDKKRYGV